MKLLVPKPGDMLLWVSPNDDERIMCIYIGFRGFEGLLWDIEAEEEFVWSNHFFATPNSERSWWWEYAV